MALSPRPPIRCLPAKNASPQNRSAGRHQSDVLEFLPLISQIQPFSKNKRENLQHNSPISAKTVESV